MQGSSALEQAETRAINQSLFNFNSCLNKLWEAQQQRGAAARLAANIPVRSSTLTTKRSDQAQATVGA